MTTYNDIERMTYFNEKNFKQIVRLTGEINFLLGQEDYSVERLNKFQNERRTAQSSIDRNIAVMERTPEWCDLDALDALKTRAKEMSVQYGVKYTADHIIPLRGDRVSGLNIPANIAICTEEFNQKKGNTFFVGQPHILDDKSLYAPGCIGK